MSDIWFDARTALRRLAASPIQTLVIVSILGSAIAGATVLGALFWAAVSDPPPIAAPEDVGRVWFADDTMPAGHRPASFADFEAWRTNTTTLSELTAVADSRVLLGDVDAVPAVALSVSPAYFALTGRALQMGRAFNAEDVRSQDGVIISSRLWRERFDGAADVVGRRISVDAAARTVIGVMPDGFWFPHRGVDLWQPLPTSPGDARTAVDIVGRLQPGRRWTDAQAELDVLAGSRTLARSLEQEGRIKFGPGLAALVAPALAILLIACANVGNLLLMRLIERARELAIRAALGASALQLARLSFVEGSLLGLIAGATGTLLAWWGTRALQLVASASPGFGAVRPGSMVIALAGTATAITVLAMAPIAAIRAGRTNVSAGFSGGLRRPVFRRLQYGVGDLLIVVQVALAVTLVLVSAFNLRLFAELVRVSDVPGGDRVRVAQITAGRTLSPEVRAARFLQVVDAVRESGGVDAVALATAYPEFGPPRSRVTVVAAGQETSCSIKVVYVTGEYFRALSLPFLAGGIGSGVAAIVTSSTVARCLGHRIDVDAQMRLAGESGMTDRWVPITGVVGDPFTSRMAGTDAMASYAWIVGAGEWPARVTIVVRSAAGAIPPLRRLAGVAMDSLTPMADRMGPGRASTALILGVFGSVSLLAVVLAFTGVYAAISASCARRMSELGIRLALGAPPRRLAASVLAHDAPLVVAGASLGAVATLWVTAVVWRDLLIFNALDVRVWAAIGGVLGVAALLASLGPALRALRVDPAALLHAE